MSKVTDRESGRAGRRGVHDDGEDVVGDILVDIVTTWTRVDCSVRSVT